ncbi:sugar kinase [Chengkuizengella axinellae]|uniref:Sugar kinase n=1 Tax=Chengkuizengella axinellae TaxID=3064388 RepID=A0ABT9ITD3_9BACL|nr:sugar kinase [Chengkuizengella sp. 2205SS18-9]MDP5272619.1 sugar kinase [Chengkuizengella sp. 2205SS18-9]
MNKQLEVITFGESMGLFTPPSDKTLETATQYFRSFGGAESNVAIGLARLGHSVGWFSRLGHDPLGVSIKKTLRGENIDVSKVKLIEGTPTGFMMRHIKTGRVEVFYHRKSSAASMMEPVDVDEQYIKQAQVLHITGITPSLSSSCRETVFHAVQIAKQNGVKVCFDPNLRLKLWSLEEARSTLLPLMEIADYFLPGLEELELLFETSDWNMIQDRLKNLEATSIVKGGKGINYVVSKDDTSEVPYELANKVVDTIGAGDAFCAGFLSGILKGLSPEKAVERAHLNASVVIQDHGDWEPLPEAEIIDQLLSKQHFVER